MKKQIVLTQDDIQQIIANAFSVDKSKVKLERIYELETYGQNEWCSPKVSATIEVQMNEQR